MQYFDFEPIGRRTSRIGFGCGRLVGRSSQWESARLLEAALELGIRYFDAAPSYGFGTAEEVIGTVIGDSKEVVVATKVGVPRPRFSARANMVRRVVKPILHRAPALKTLVRRATMRWERAPVERARYDFSAGAIGASLEASLQRMRRRSVDVFLAHEPHRLDVCDEVAARFESLRGEGWVTAFGVGIGSVGDRWERFGSIWQSCWPGHAASGYAHDVAYIWHGAIRTMQARDAGGHRVHPSAVVRQVLRESPGSILLVSASTPARLRDLLREIDP